MLLCNLHELHPMHLSKSLHLCPHHHPFELQSTGLRPILQPNRPFRLCIEETRHPQRLLDYTTSSFKWEGVSVQLHLARHSSAYASNIFQLVEEKSSLMELFSVVVGFSIPLFRSEPVPKAFYFMLKELKFAFQERILYLQVRDFTGVSRRQFHCLLCLCIFSREV